VGEAAHRAPDRQPRPQETVACAWLSAITLAGLGLNAALGWWWADPVAGLAMIPWLVREGREVWEGEDECCG
jgi:hypothetical protein